MEFNKGMVLHKYYSFTIGVPSNRVEGYLFGIH